MNDLFGNGKRQADLLNIRKTIYSEKHIEARLTVSDKIRILFACVADSARSRMAEALLRPIDSEPSAAFSAGTAPATVHPRALNALAGIRRRAHYPVRDNGSRMPGGARRGECLAWNAENPASSDTPDAYCHTLHELHERITMCMPVKNNH